MVVPKKSIWQRFKERRYWFRIRVILSKRWLNWKNRKKLNSVLEIQSLKHGAKRR